MYAQRMIQVYASTDDDVPSEDILHLVNLDQSRKPLMPKLQLLNWTTGRLSLPWLHHLLSPSLSEVHVDLNGGRATPVNVAVIRALPTTHLKHIAFSTLHTNPEVSDALLDLLFKSRQIVSIYIQQEDNAEDTNPPGDVAKDELEPIELRALTSVIIAFKKEPTFLPSFFDRTTLPKAQQIYLQHTGRTEWLGCDSLFHHMLRSVSPSALYALRFTSHYHGMDITSAEIQTLRSFTALSTVRVTSLCSAARCKFFLSDDDISVIATAMPNLTELCLGGTPCMSTMVNVSMDSLAVLAAKCTKLKDLQIHFDTAGFINRALDVPTEPVPPPQSKPSLCQLTQLNVGRIPLGRSTDGYWTVGMALLQIFPNLKTIKHHQQALFGGDWGDVMRIIKVQRNIGNLTSGTPDVFVLLHLPNTQPV